MKTVKILGVGRVAAERNGVTRVEYFEALRKVSKWNGIDPYQADQAIINKKKELSANVQFKKTTRRRDENDRTSN